MRRFLLSKLTKNISIAWRLHFAILAKHLHNRVTRFRKKKTSIAWHFAILAKHPHKRGGGKEGKRIRISGKTNTTIA